MPYGVPLTDEERKIRHLSRYGTLDNFPQVRLGRASVLSEMYDTAVPMILLGLGIIMIVLAAEMR